MFLRASLLPTTQSGGDASVLLSCDGAMQKYDGDQMTDHFEFKMVPLQGFDAFIILIKS